MRISQLEELQKITLDENLVYAWPSRQIGRWIKVLPVFLQVSFQATIGRNYLGGIAVDDVTLTNGLCEDESEPQNNKQGINLISSLNFVEVLLPHG